MISIARAQRALMLAALACPVIAHAQDRKLSFSDIPWQHGPTTGNLGKEAQVAVPDGCVFTGEDGVGLFDELTENVANPNERGVIVCSGNWFVFFTYSDVGHVKDDERNSLDADVILTSLKNANEGANKERLKRGWPTLTTLGWMTPPHYDTATHNLTWATTLLSSGGEKTVNHSVRLLGRTGVMDVDLVVTPEEIAEALPALDSLVAGFGFVSGHRYAEWRAGDRVAKYGLTGLIVGGAAVAAVNSGLLVRFWKVIVAAVVAGVAALKRVFRGNRQASTTVRT